MEKEMTLKEKLANGKSAIGTWCIIPSATTIDIIASAGMDFVIIDMEHGPSTFETAENMIRAAENFNCSPLIRVPHNEESIILRALEIGSHGVVIPQITSEKDARYALESMKYHPLGNRGFSPFTRSSGYSPLDTKTISTSRNEQSLCVLIVEGEVGIANLDNILEIDKVDVIYIGSYDLSQSAGYPGQSHHPKVLKYIEKSVEKINKNGKIAGCLAQSDEDIKNWIEMGIQFIPYKADCAILHTSTKAITDNFKRIKEK